MHTESHKLINSIWNKEELPQRWNDFNIVPIYTKGDENFREIPLLSTRFTILSNIPG
jgi:hypothetical protein